MALSTQLFVFFIFWIITMSFFCLLYQFERYKLKKVMRNYGYSDRFISKMLD